MQWATDLESRVLVLAPLGRDAELTCIALREASIRCEPFATLDDLCTALHQGASAAVVSEEAFADHRVDRLAAALRMQPTWSDLPVIFLTSGRGSAIESRITGEAMALLGNVQLLERPTRVGTLLSVVRAALRARERQYQIREHMRRQQITEYALRRSEAQLTCALEAAAFGSWDLDLLTGEMGRSLRHDQIFGYSELRPEWTFDTFLEHVHPDDRQRVKDEFRLAIETGKPWMVECRIVRADGEERWVWADGGLQREMLGDDGLVRAASPPARMVGLISDITARKRTESVLARRTEELGRSNAELQDFAYAASHDLKEPLRGISNYAHFLLDDEGDQLSEQARERLHTIIRLSQRMYALLDSLLDYSRVGRTQLVLAEADLNLVATEIVDSMRPWLEERDAEVVIKGPLPIVPCDRIRAGQVFMNLIANGVKYNEGKPRRVEIGAMSEWGVPILYVRDNGIGIPERHLGTIFKMFRRLHPRDQYGGGTGAGLALVKRIIERHGGRIWVRSRPGQGTTFFFTLCEPVSEAAPAIVADAENEEGLVQIV
jgi:signal transduction histidine kinase